MRKDTSFGERKLTPEEFGEKYWKGNDREFVDQYHTMTIEDGRDEREQLIINNIRALWNLNKGVLRIKCWFPEVARQAEKTAKLVTASLTVGIVAMVGLVALTLALLL